MANLIEQLKTNLRVKREKELVARAKDLYQIKEYDGETWLTFNDVLILPTSMIQGDIITVLNQMRASYVERNLL